MSDEKKDESIEGTFTNEELLKMLQEKQIEANEAQSELLKSQTEYRQLQIDSRKIFAENSKLQAQIASMSASPETLAAMADMEVQLKMAEYFVQSQAFTVKNAAEAYVKIQAGAEMGMKPMESMQALYIHKGAIKFYGDKMIARATKLGYKIEYLNETDSSVDVRVYHPDPLINFDVTEKANAAEKSIADKQAMKYARFNKLRFHGFRKIATFHLPHLFGSVEDEFSSDFREWKSNQLASGKDENENTLVLVKDQDLLQQIKDCKDLAELEELHNENKASITRNITIASAFGKAKKSFEI